MDDIKFSSLKDLYNSVLPALRCRCRELKRSGYVYIHEEDIWNYLKETKWTTSSNLTLFDMVSNILDTTINELESYMKLVSEHSRRTIITDDEKLL